MEWKGESFNTHHHYNQALFGQAHILSHEIITDNQELVRTIREGKVVENTKIWLDADRPIISLLKTKAQLSNLCWNPFHVRKENDLIFSYYCSFGKKKPKPLLLYKL